MIPDCSIECYDRFLFFVIPDSVLPDSIIPDSVLPDSIIPDSCFISTLLYLFPLYPIQLYPIPVWHVIIISVIPGSLHSPNGKTRQPSLGVTRSASCRFPFTLLPSPANLPKSKCLHACKQNFQLNELMVWSSLLPACRLIQLSTTANTASRLVIKRRPASFYHSSFQPSWPGQEASSRNDGLRARTLERMPHARQQFLNPKLCTWCKYQLNRSNCGRVLVIMHGWVTVRTPLSFELEFELEPYMSLDEQSCLPTYPNPSPLRQWAQLAVGRCPSQPAITCQGPAGAQRHSGQLHSNHSN